MTVKMTYGEQLRHPNWQRLRLELLSAARWKCEACGDGDTTLHVHHRRYIKGRLAWEYPPENFAVLCDPCHQDAHETREELLLVLCATETFPQAGITEADLVALCRSFLLIAAGGVSGDDGGLWAMGRGSNRVANVGHIAAALFNSQLTTTEIANLSGLLVDDFGLTSLRGLLKAADERIAAQVQADLDEGRKKGPG